MFPYQFSLAPAFSIRDLWGPRHMISRIYNSEFWIHTYQVFLPVYKADDSGIIADILRETNQKLKEFLSEFHMEKIGACDTTVTQIKKWWGLVSNSKTLRFAQYELNINIQKN